MSQLTVQIRFATGFRIGTGTAGRSYDEVVDRSDPLRASSLKGLLRAEARSLLPGPDPSRVDHPLVNAVFGGRRQQSPWHWRTEVPEKPQIVPQVNLKLDEQGQAKDGHLLVKELVGLQQAEMQITQTGPVTTAGLPQAASDPVQYHLALLHLAARMVEKVGQRRTRGLGWVCLEVPDRDLRQDLDLIWPLREDSAA